MKIQIKLTKIEINWNKEFLVKYHGADTLISCLRLKLDNFALNNADYYLEAVDCPFRKVGCKMILSLNDK